MEKEQLQAVERCVAILLKPVPKNPNYEKDSLTILKIVDVPVKEPQAVVTWFRENFNPVSFLSNVLVSFCRANQLVIAVGTQPTDKKECLTEHMNRIMFIPNPQQYGFDYLREVICAYEKIVLELGCEVPAVFNGSISKSKSKSKSEQNDSSKSKSNSKREKKTQSSRTRSISNNDTMKSQCQVLGEQRETMSWLRRIIMSFFDMEHTNPVIQAETVNLIKLLQSSKVQTSISKCLLKFLKTQAKAHQT